MMTDSAYPHLAGVIEDLISAEPNASARYLLTGESGSGKTTWCLKLVEIARESGLAVGGVISPGVYAGDRHVAIDIWDIGTDARRLLARLRPKPDQAAATKKWEMDPDAIGWGNSVLSRPGELDLLVVDEIGPLEFIHARGLLAAIQAVDRGNYRAAVIVVRPSLLEAALQRWPDSQVLQLPGPPPSVR